MNINQSQQVLFAILALVLIALSPVTAADAYLSPSAMVASADQDTLIVAESEANRLAFVSQTSGKIVKHVDLPVAPSGLCLSADGRRLYVTGGHENGQVLALNLATGKIESKSPLGHTPTAPVLSLDGKSLYVCQTYNNNVAVIRTRDLKGVVHIPVDREPVAAQLSQDGSRLYVLNLLPSMRADLDYTGAAVSVIDTRKNEVSTSITMPNGTIHLRGICLSPDGQYAYVTHILSRYTVPTSQLQRGWINTNAVTVLDARTARIVNTVLLDDVDNGAANPWDITCTADGQWLCTTHAGTNEISLIDRAKLHERLDQAAQGRRVTEVTQSAESVPNDLSFLTGIKQRVRLGGIGPRALIAVGNTLYAAEYFSDTLAVLDTSGLPLRASAIALAPPPTLSQIRQGEMLFNTATTCFQQWQSCASCHTEDARSDGLNWDLLNDGLGNPKNTKSLLLAHQTPPTMSLGVRASAEVAVRAGIRHIQFAQRPESEALAMDAYLKSLKAIPSPHLVKGKLSRSAKRGQAVFNKANCVRCHSGPLHTNLKSFNVGTGQNREEGMSFDTPSLVEIWRNAPYLHNGSATTVRDVLTTFNPSDTHGKTSDLTDRELTDLETYLLSL
ncbi:MAG: cell surface protein [Planctomycetes bacterium]|nr:cell surface protein [Planctomycetota bacterium]